MSRMAIRIGRWTFIPEFHLLTGDGVERHLEPKQAAVLVRLASDPGAVLSKAELLDLVWGEVHVTDEVLTNTIYQLRRALGDSAREQQYIQTIPKKGYRLVAGVEPVAANRTNRPPRRRWMIAAVALLAISLVFTGSRVTSETDDPQPSTALVENGEALLDAASPGSTLAALRIFEEATVSNPALASAWSGLASARWLLVSDSEVSATVGLPLVEQATARAIELDANAPRSWTVLGLAHTARWNWKEAERALTRAVDLDPGSGKAHSAYAQFLLLTGRAKEARNEIDIARSLAPESRSVLLSAGFVYTMLRDADSASDAYRAVLTLDPADGEARKQLEKLESRERSPGDSEMTIAKIDQLLKKRPLRPAIVAGMFAEAGEDDKAIEWLSRAREEKDLSLLLVRLDDRWTRLHGDDRFRAILNDVGL